jgi:hypothetical protein
MYGMVRQKPFSFFKEICNKKISQQFKKVQRLVVAKAFFLEFLFSIFSYFSFKKERKKLLLSTFLFLVKKKEKIF